MAILFDPLLNATQSDIITLIVGEDDKQIKINAPKDVLSMKSETMAKLIQKAGDTLNMSSESTKAVQMFVTWCYQDRLQPLPATATAAERKIQKNALMDLWIFSARYDIPKLQNEAMRELLALLEHLQLLDEEDFQVAWRQSPETVQELKWLVVYALVAQVEEGGRNIGRFERLVGFQGFFPMMYEAKGLWDCCETPKTPKKGKARSKWSVFCKTEEVQEALIVEVKPPLRTPQKRSVPSDRNVGSGGSSKKTKGFMGFKPAEMVDLTIDDGDDDDE